MQCSRWSSLGWMTEEQHPAAIWPQTQSFICPTCPYSSLSSSCRRQRGSSADGSCTICTISGRRVPISEEVMLKRNCGVGKGARHQDQSQGQRARAGMWRLEAPSFMPHPKERLQQRRLAVRLPSNGHNLRDVERLLGARAWRQGGCTSIQQRRWQCRRVAAARIVSAHLAKGHGSGLQARVSLIADLARRVVKQVVGLAGPAARHRGGGRSGGRRQAAAAGGRRPLGGV